MLNSQRSVFIWDVVDVSVRQVGKALGVFLTPNSPGKIFKRSICLNGYLMRVCMIQFDPNQLLCEIMWRQFEVFVGPRYFKVFAVNIRSKFHSSLSQFVFQALLHYWWSILLLSLQRSPPVCNNFGSIRCDASCRTPTIDGFRYFRRYSRRSFSIVVQSVLS